MVRMKFDATETFDQLKDRWALEVGRFVMAFGGIEGTTYLALRQLPSDPIGAPLIQANLGLGARIDVLVAVCSGKDGARNEFAEALKRIKVLASKRNLIAHNSMGFDIYTDSAGGYYIEQAISNARKANKSAQRKKDESVLFDELVEHREDAEALNMELSNTLTVILKELGLSDESDSSGLGSRL